MFSAAQNGERGNITYALSEPVLGERIFVEFIFKKVKGEMRVKGSIPNLSYMPL
jgi:hypothetical protein